MTATTIPVRTEDAPAEQPIEIVETRGRGDKTFFRGIGLSGFLVLALMAAVGIFLTYEGLNALRVAGPSFLTTSEWQPDAGHRRVRHRGDPAVHDPDRLDRRGDRRTRSRSAPRCSSPRWRRRACGRRSSPWST